MRARRERSTTERIDAENYVGTTLFMIRLTQLFPLWALIISVWAWLQPGAFDTFGDWIVPLLAVVMFGMGLTLQVSDFERILRMPGLITTGLLLQYTIMPAAALTIATLFGFDPVMTAGMVLVGASPGGTASNVICYLARGNVALSISLTAISTLLAIVMTPLLALMLIGASIQVPADKMLLSILYMVIVPVALGVSVNRYAGHRLKPLRHVFPFISVAAIVFIIAIIIALNADQLGRIGIVLVAAVMLHNSIGLVFGYYAGRTLGYSTTECRTLAIEVGMQNSGLAVALAIQYFSAAAALAGAIFSIWHNLSGSMLAAFWAKQR